MKPLRLQWHLRWDKVVWGGSNFFLRAISLERMVCSAVSRHTDTDPVIYSKDFFFKVKNLIQENSPALDDSLNDYPGSTSRGGSCGPISYSRETTPNKSLRFKVRLGTRFFG